MAVPDGLPMRLPPTDEQRHANLVRAGMAGGRSKSLRPIPRGSGVQTQPDEPDQPGLERLSAYYSVADTTTLTGDVFTIPSWGTFETAGTSVGLATPDDGVIHIFVEGVYAVNLTLALPAGVAAAAVGCSVRLYADLIVSYGANDIGCGIRGGDGCADVPTFAATSYTYWFPVGGSVAPALTYQNLDTTAVPHFDVNVDVVRLG